MSTRQQTHIALEKFRRLTESLVEGIQDSLQGSRAPGGTHSAVTLVKDFSPVIDTLSECEKTIRSLLARARRQEQLKKQTDKIKDIMLMNEERLVKTVFFPTHEVDGSLRRAINKSKFVCGTSVAGAPGPKPPVMDAESLANYLSEMKFMVPPSLKLFCYDDSMGSYSAYRCKSTDDEYRTWMATSESRDNDSGSYLGSVGDDNDDLGQQFPN